MSHFLRCCLAVWAGLSVGCTSAYFGLMYAIWWPCWAVVASCTTGLVMGEDMLHWWYGYDTGDLGEPR